MNVDADILITVETCKGKATVKGVFNDPDSEVPEAAINELVAPLIKGHNRVGKLHEAGYFMQVSTVIKIVLISQVEVEIIPSPEMLHALQ